MKDLSSKDATLGEVSTYESGVLQSSAQRVLKKYTDACLKEHGITTMQWFIIGTIYDSGNNGISVSSLAKIMGTNLPYITNTLNLLDSKKITKRIDKSGDGRSKQVIIQPSFRPKCIKIESDLRIKMRKGIYAYIEPGQLKTYLLVLQQLNTLG